MRQQHSKPLSPRPQEATIPSFTTTSTIATAREDGAHMEICREIAMGNKLPSREAMLDSSSPGRDFVQYHNGQHFVAILGELLAQTKRRRLTRIVIQDDQHSLTYHQAIQPDVLGNNSPDLQPPESLDSPELEFLNKKQAFSLPPEPHWQVLLPLLAHI
jgi:hypothetical protein